MRQSAASGLLAVILLVVWGALSVAQAAQPDITGVWSPIWNRDKGKVDPKLLPPWPGPPALKGEYKAKYSAFEKQRAALLATNRVDPASLIAQNETSCTPYGMPGMMLAIYTIEILQTPGQVTVLGEAMRDVRRIYLDKPQLPIDEVAPGYYGRSVGHWGGDTLVVDTVGIKPEVIGMGLFHSPQMRITERLRLVRADLLLNEITVVDPLALERPYRFSVLLIRMPGYETPEWVCEQVRETVNEHGEVVFKAPPQH